MFYLISYGNGDVLNFFPPLMIFFQITKKSSKIKTVKIVFMIYFSNEIIQL